MLKHYFIADAKGEKNGAISHIVLYGGSGPTSVPEPATLSMLGVGLFGLSIASGCGELKTTQSPPGDTLLFQERRTAVLITQRGSGRVLVVGPHRAD